MTPASATKPPTNGANGHGGARPGAGRPRKAPAANGGGQNGASGHNGATATPARNARNARIRHLNEELSRDGHAPTARDRLVDAAAELLADSGYETLTVGAVCERAGLSRQTFYSHFADKRALVAALHGTDLEEIDRRLRRAAEDANPLALSLAEALEDSLGQAHPSASTPRARLTRAMIEIASERGFGAASVADLAAAAGLSRGVFYRNFHDPLACLAAAHEALLERIEASLAEATAGAQEAERVRIGLEALCYLLAAEPATARIVLVEAGALRRPVPSGPSAADDAERRAAERPRRLADVLDRVVLADLAEASEDARRFAAAGVVSILRSQFVAEAPGSDLRSLAPDLAFAALSSLVGLEATLAEIEAARGAGAMPGGLSFKADRDPERVPARTQQPATRATGAAA